MKGTIKVLGQDIELANLETHPGLEDELAKTLQEEIDWEVMIDILTEIGWTKIETTWSCQSVEDAYELKEWCSRNIEDHYKARGKTWIFAKEKDAVKFSLRWA